MNFLQICQTIADELDLDRPSTVYNADLGQLSQPIRRIRNNVNEAYSLIKLWLNRKNESAETSGTITTVAGTEAYNFPSGILTISQLKVGTDAPIRIIPWPEYEVYKSDTLVITLAGSPDIASIYGRQVYLYPTPDAAYTVTVRGLETLTTLDADADTPDLPTEFHYAIKNLALYYEMTYEGNPNAGLLVTNENGPVTAQGGQAARFLQNFNALRAGFGNHMSEPPRMRSIQELRLQNRLRRITRTQF